MAPSFKYKLVDRSVTHHSKEKRGFVTVPLDYEDSESPKIEIFYRLIPAYGSTVDDATKPIIVVFNGGPGIPSHVYRSLDFDYENNESEKNAGFNRFKFLLKTHRILLSDQRGTDGNSAPLDLNDPATNGHDIAAYFSSNFQARDYLAVIEEVVPKSESFFIIAQSYGGMVGMQYLNLQNARVPKGLLFTCSALPYEDVMDAMLSRRQEQLNLNLQLKKSIPEIDVKLNRARTHLQSFQMDPNHLNGLYHYLGKSEAGLWEKVFESQIDRLLTLDRSGLENEFNDSIGVGNVLNYILSSANFTPGETDRTLAEVTSKRIPFESWMVDENWVLLQVGQGNPVTERVISEMDRRPPNATPFAKVVQTRTAIKKFQILFVSADNDAYVPAESFKRSYEKFKVPGHTHEIQLPGGHHAIFLEEGHRVLLDWPQSI